MAAFQGAIDNWKNAGANGASYFSEELGWNNAERAGRGLHRRDDMMRFW